MPDTPIALELYTVRDETARDFPGTLRKVAEIGYAGVEFAGYGGLTSSEMKRLLDDLGLQPAGSHVGIDQLMQDLPAVIDYQLEIGNLYVVCPWLPEEYCADADAWKRTAEQFNRIGAECARHNLIFGYHNHAFEFERFDGQTGFDILFANTNPADVQAEIDLYWVVKGGEDPVAMIRRFAGRLPLLHIKDMAADAEGSFAEIGAGILPWDDIFPAAHDAGIKWYVVEQDVCKRPSLESAQISFEYLRARGLV